MTTAAARPPEHAVRFAAAFSTLLLVVAALVLVQLPDAGSPLFDAPWWIVFPIGVGFAVADRFLFDISLRRESISFSLSEVPAVFALAFLSPIVAVAMRLVAGAASEVGRRRRPWFKMYFNLALFALEVAVSFAIVRAIVEPGADDAGSFMIAAAVAMLVSAAIGFLAVCAVIAFFEGDIVRQLRLALPSAALTALIGAMVAAVAIAPAFIGLEYAVLPLVPILAAWMVLHRYGVLFQEHRDLSDLHDFTRILDQSIRLDDVAPEAVDEIGRLLSARRVTMRIAHHRAGGSDAHREWCIGEPLAVGDTTLVSAEHAVPTGSDDETGLDAITVELRHDDVVIGTLSLGDRRGEPGWFTADMVSRALDLADQLSINVRNGLLHAEVEQAARLDGLTGDVNRSAFELRLLDELSTPRSVSRLAVLMLDLNNFKDVNDTLGHHVGDQVLGEFSRRVRNELGPDDVLSRFGGDEFALLMRRRTADQIRDVAESILTASYSPLELEACDAVVTTSIGIAYVHEHDLDPVAVVRRADIAMYAAKHRRSGVEVYREEIDRRTPARLSLLGDLRSAIERDELEVHYQPKIDLVSSTVIGAEALVRWDDSGRGWVAPSDFIGAAEESGLVRLVTEVVLTKAIRRARGWVDAGFDFHVSVNLSALDLHAEQLVPFVRDRLDEYGLEPGRLVVEMTESALMVDSVRTLETIEQLDLLGVRLSLDDFGTGYSSLSHLRQLPVSELKIDRSFVSDLLVNVHDDVIVRSTIDLGHNLGLRVVAEGIESAQVGDHLMMLGCDVGQGFGIARPLEPESFERWLDTTVHRVARLGDERTLI